MRVIAGEHRGRTLRAPKGDATRPTTDRVRESLFSTIASERGGFEGAVVLDAFAGSGALGVEALSRGAHSAVFCECNRQALDALRANTAFLDKGAVRIVGGDVFKRAVRCAREPFDLVFLDPPYDLDPAQVVRLLGDLANQGCLAPDAIVSYERDAGHTALFDAADANGQGGLEWQLRTTKRFGDTAIDLYRRTEP